MSLRATQAGASAILQGQSVRVTQAGVSIILGQGTNLRAAQLGASGIVAQNYVFNAPGPRWISVTPIAPTDAIAYPEVNNAATQVEYQWRLSSSPDDWSVLIGSSTLTGSSRFQAPLAGLTLGQLHKVRVRYHLPGGVSGWEEREWLQNVNFSAALPGGFTEPIYPGFLISGISPISWELGGGWTAVELSVSTDNSVWTPLASGGALSSRTYSFDPSSYSQHDYLYIRLEVTDGVDTEYLYTAFIYDAGSSWMSFGVDNCLSAADLANTKILGTGQVHMIPSTAVIDPCGFYADAVGSPDAAILVPASLGIGADGFHASAAGASWAPGATLQWWIDQEVQGSFFGFKYIDEDENPWVIAQFLWGQNMPPCWGQLIGNGLVSFGVRLNIPGASGPIALASSIIQSKGMCPACEQMGAACACDQIPMNISASMRKVADIGSAVRYDWEFRAIGYGSSYRASGQVDIVGGLPCGTVVPYIGRVSNNNFQGYPILKGFGAGLQGASCGFVPPSTPNPPPTQSSPPIPEIAPIVSPEPQPQVEPCEPIPELRLKPVESTRDAAVAIEELLDRMNVVIRTVNSILECECPDCLRQLFEEEEEA